MAAIFAYLSFLWYREIRCHYFDEIAHVLEQNFRFPMMIRNMDYIEQLVDPMLGVPVKHVLDASHLGDRCDPAVIGSRLDAMRLQYARGCFISPAAPHDKISYFVNTPISSE